MPRHRHPENAPGDWYVDENCIDCGASRTVAPGLIAHKGGQCVFVRQPESEADLRLAWRAQLLCPTASVRSEGKDAMPAGVFPEPMAENIFRLGFNGRSSWGAHSFLIRRAQGNAMVDSPRFASQVVPALEGMGGLQMILLTHRDDVADAHLYAERFGARVFIHEADRSAAPYATDLITGRAASDIAPDLRVIPMPGHTRGSVAYLHGAALFTGDSLSWEFETDGLRASRAVCWYSWPEQLQSLERLLACRFEWVFAGHGGSKHLPADQMAAQLRALLVRLHDAA
jgi:glyoxylase-like metal-dependent hydrolase (beta-lactamase superfamily II)